MTEVLKIIVISIVGVLIKALIKNIKSEYSAFITIGCGIAIFAVAIPDILSVIKELKSTITISASDSGYIFIFLKCIIICEICVLAKNFCRDSGEHFLSSCIDLAEKISIIIVSFPLFKAVFEIIKGFIGS